MLNTVKNTSPIDDDQIEFVFTNDDNDEIVLGDTAQLELDSEWDGGQRTLAEKPWKILIVDDDSEIHTMTRVALRGFTFEGKPLLLISAYSAQEAKELIKKHSDTALVLLDVVMEENDSGLQVVEYIRNVLNNHLVRIILRTGQPGEAPAEATIINYTINDYKTKTDLSYEKLFITMISTLRSYQDVLTIETNRQKLAENMKSLKKEIDERKQIEKALQKAKETAETANQAKSEFLANMSHELRTPLNGILGFAQILQRDVLLNQHQNKAVNTIYQSGKHLLTLLNDILDLSKVEAGKMDIIAVEFHFLNFINNIVDIFQIQAQQKNITFTYKTSPNLPTAVKGDERRLRQIIINLLGNAIKFTEQGQVTLTVNQHHHYIRFEVEDTGIGIAPNHLETIFSPFQQVNSWRSQTDGTGLGLAISQRLVQYLGSVLNVESVLGKGSKFWFDLDLPIVETIDEPLQEDMPLIIGIKGETRKILVVDDKWENRVILFDLLSPLGFTIVEAVNGKDAIEKAETFQPDIILMDLVMSVMDGYEATRYLRQSPIFKDVIIIALSATVFGLDRQKSLEIGCNDFISKPFRVDELLSTLETHLNLTWVYQKQSTKTISETTIQNNVPSPPIITPPQEKLSELLELANQGDVRKLEKELIALEQLDIQYQPFIMLIHPLLKKYRLKQIIETLTAHIDSSTE